MRREARQIESETARDVRLPNGCLLCGGELHVRIGAGSAASVCMSCRWISHPQMQRHEDGVHVVHPAGGTA